MNTCCSECKLQWKYYFLSANNETICEYCYNRKLICVYCKEPTQLESWQYHQAAHADCVEKELQLQGFIDMNDEMQKMKVNGKDAPWAPSIRTTKTLYVCCHTCVLYDSVDVMRIVDKMWMCDKCFTNK